ncbi:MAG: hypothetical protein IKN27_01465, partial [Selenomonadaceae bacterium]|nr:hypothetical protein [Selenomonadaceae bacterium]
MKFIKMESDIFSATPQIGGSEVFARYVRADIFDELLITAIGEDIANPEGFVVEGWVYDNGLEDEDADCYYIKSFHTFAEAEAY